MSDVERAFVWDHSPYKGSEKLLHLKMADLANDTHGRRLWIGDRTLAEKASCDERTVRRFKARAIKDGYLEDLGRNAETGFKEYRFLIPASSELADNLSGADRTSRPDDRTFHPDSPDISSNAPLINQIGTKEPIRAIAREDEFDQTWDHYPRRLNRKAALRSYLARRDEGTSAGDLQSATVNYAKATAHSDRKFVMYGSRFFGQDEPFRDYVDGVPQLESADSGSSSSPAPIQSGAEQLAVSLARSDIGEQQALQEIAEHCHWTPAETGPAVEAFHRTRRSMGLTA